MRIYVRGNRGDNRETSRVNRRSGGVYGNGRKAGRRYNVIRFIS